MKRTVRNRSYMLFFNLKCVGTTASEFSRLPASFSVRGLCTIGAWALHHPFGSQARCVQRIRTILDGIPLRREMAEVVVSLFPFSVTPTLLGATALKTIRSTLLLMPMQSSRPRSIFRLSLFHKMPSTTRVMEKLHKT